MKARTNEWRYILCNFLHSPDTPSLLGTNILLIDVFSDRRKLRDQISRGRNYRFLYVCFQYHNGRQIILHSVVTSTVFRMFSGFYLIFTVVCKFFNLVNISYRQALRAVCVSTCRLLCQVTFAQLCICIPSFNLLQEVYVSTNVCPVCNTIQETARWSFTM